MLIMDYNVYLFADRFPLIRDIGWNRVEGSYTHPDRVMEMDVFLFVAEGQIKVIEEEHNYIVNKGEHLFLKKGLHHWGITYETAATSWYWIHFSNEIDNEDVYRDILPLPELGYSSPDHYKYRIKMCKHGSSSLHEDLGQRLLNLLDHYLKPQIHGMTLISMEVFRFFLDLHQATMDSHSFIQQTEDGSALVGKVLTYLSNHADRPFNSKNLSMKLKFNYNYLSAVFSKQTGYSIIEVHTKLRISKAIDMMKNTSLNVSEISEQLGFSNPFYFSRVFKKVVGEAPSTYKKYIYK
jgi:AraC family transcriptional regulator of arabinose operon